jgi:hypothetical protein
MRIVQPLLRCLAGDGALPPSDVFTAPAHPNGALVHARRLAMTPTRPDPPRIDHLNRFQRGPRRNETNETKTVAR